MVASAGVHLGATLLFALRGLDIAILGVAWLAYVVRRLVVDPDAAARWGLTRRGLRPSALAGVALLATAGGALAAWAAVRGTLLFDGHMLPLLVLYPLWGLVQQFLVLSIRLQTLEAELAVRCRPCLVLVGALAFGAVHLPDVPLAVATLLLGAVLSAIFLRWRCLWPLGVAHGWLGVAFYRWVLQRDPWAELFG